jgi:hypothetical protein
MRAPTAAADASDRCRAQLGPDAGRAAHGSDRERDGAGDRIRFTELPMSPPKVLKAIDVARTNGGS